MNTREKITSLPARLAAQPLLFAEAPKHFDYHLRRIWAESSFEAASTGKRLAAAFEQDPHSIDFVVVADRLTHQLASSAIERENLSCQTKSARQKQLTSYTENLVSRHIRSLMPPEQLEIWRQDPLTRESYHQMARELALLLERFIKAQVPVELTSRHLGVMHHLTAMSRVSGLIYNFVLFENSW
jgi:hypothetical protein